MMQSFTKSALWSLRWLIGLPALLFWLSALADYLGDLGAAAPDSQSRLMLLPPASSAPKDIWLSFFISVMAIVLAGYAVLGLLHLFFRSGKAPSVGVCRVLYRLCQRHIHFVLYASAFGALILYSIMKIFGKGAAKPKPDGGGPQSEKFAGFANTVTAPARWAVEGIIFFLSAIVLAIGVSFGWLSTHPAAMAITGLSIYLIWLISAVNSEWRKEFPPDYLLRDTHDETAFWGVCKKTHKVAEWCDPIRHHWCESCHRDVEPWHWNDWFEYCQRCVNRLDSAGGLFRASSWRTARLDQLGERRRADEEWDRELEEMRKEDEARREASVYSGVFRTEERGEVWTGNVECKSCHLEAIGMTGEEARALEYGEPFPGFVHAPGCEFAPREIRMTDGTPVNLAAHAVGMAATTARLGSAIRAAKAALKEFKAAGEAGNDRAAEKKPDASGN